MSRPKKILRKKFVVFCEGETEYNYIDRMRKNQGVEIAIEPVNMHGGGYSNFLKVIRTKSNTNCLAKFVIVDCDRISADQGERQNFLALLDYCRRQNAMKTVPHFLIVDQPDFEYVSCLHDPDFRGQDTSRYITDKWRYRNLQAFKADRNVYEFLNSNGRSYSNMLSSLNKEQCVIVNDYIVRKNKFDIEIKGTRLELDNCMSRGSNINEFFDVIEW